jgi:hypothetical protein
METYDDSNSVATPGVGPTETTAPSAPSWTSANPNQDPAYLAFLRGAGFNQSQIQAQTAKQKAGLQAQLEAQKPYWAQQIQTGVRNALDNAANRGTTRGSNRIENQNQATTAVNQAQASYETNVANQQAGLDASSATQLAQLQQQQAEQTLQAQNNVYNSQLGQYQSDLQNYYLNQLLGM